MAELNAAARAAVMKALLDRLGQTYEDERSAADSMLRDLYEKYGVTKLEIKVPGLGKVGTLSLSRPEAKIAVDEDRLLNWTSERHPEHVEKVTTEKVRSAFRKLIIGRLAVDEPTQVVVDTETGEAVPWARVVPAGRGQVTMMFDKEGRAAIEHGWESGAIDREMSKAEIEAGEGQ